MLVRCAAVWRKINLAFERYCESGDKQSAPHCELTLLMQTKAALLCSRCVCVVSLSDLSHLTREHLWLRVSHRLSVTTHLNVSTVTSLGYICDNTHTEAVFHLRCLSLLLPHLQINHLLEMEIFSLRSATIVFAWDLSACLHTQDAPSAANKGIKEV